MVNDTCGRVGQGVESYPIQLGDLELPPTARLKVLQHNFTTQPLDLVTLADVPSSSSGAVLSVKVDAEVSCHDAAGIWVGFFQECRHSPCGQASQLTFLEACMRVLIDGAAEPMFLSSGGEDYFLSAYYFNEDEFHTPNSGLTLKVGGNMSACERSFKHRFSANLKRCFVDNASLINKACRCWQTRRTTGIRCCSAQA